VSASQEERNTTRNDGNINMEKERIKSKFNEQMKRLMVEDENYQGALNLLMQIEDEASDDVRSDGSSIMDLSLYCYLFVILGRDDDALQKIMENKLQNDIREAIDYDFLFQLKCRNHFLQVTIMARLNMVDDIINEINTILGKHNTETLIQENNPLIYSSLLSLLSGAQIIKGDFEQALHIIKQGKCFINQNRVGTLAQQLPLLFDYELFGVQEYYVNNLTQTHIFHFSKSKPAPPTSPLDGQDGIDFQIPCIEYEIVSKTDDSIFTIEDFRKATTVPIVDPFSIADPFFELENNEDTTESK
jgi:hypothetical protein